MNDITRALYQFVLENSLNPWQDPEYKSASLYANEKKEALCKQLDKDGQELLKDMIDHHLLMHSMEAEQLFTSTLCLCRELRGILG